MPPRKWEISEDSIEEGVAKSGVTCVFFPCKDVVVVGREGMISG